MHYGTPPRGPHGDRGHDRGHHGFIVDVPKVNYDDDCCGPEGEEEDDDDCCGPEEDGDEEDDDADDG